MANTRTLQRSFTGGELTPEFFGKIDDAKYALGLAKCRNFVVKPQGPVENRPGFQFVREVKDSTKKVRLIPFTYSTTQTMVIEMGDLYFRFHTNGGTLMDGDDPYEIESPYVEADLFDIHYVQSSDVLTLVHQNYAPRELRRQGATDWTLDEIIMSPRVEPPSAIDVEGVPITHKYRVSALKKSTTTFIVSETEASDEITVDNDLTVAGAYNALSWDRVSRATGYRVYKWDGTVFGYLATTNDTKFNDAGGVAPSADKNPLDDSPVSGIPDNLVISAVLPTLETVSAIATVPSGADSLVTQEYVVTSVFENDESIQSDIATCSNNLYVTGAYNTIEWPSVSGATSFNIYRRSGGLFGYVGQSVSTQFIDDNIAPDMGKTPPQTTDPFVTAGNFPAAVSYFEQRRVFAGTINSPQNIWMTKSGTESNMSYSLPIRDDDRIAFRVAAREANTIRHIVPLSQLLLLTSSAEWRVTSVNSDAITPTTISVRPQSYVGANNVQPVIINNSLLYAVARGGHVYELGYAWQASGFTTGDLSIRAPHLFDSFDIVDMTYSKAPLPLVWFVSTSGKLLGLTYVPEHQIGAWHQHDTDGEFESCTSVAEGSEDSLYVIVKRTIDGAQKRYIERMASRQFVDQEDAFFVDCGMTYSGAPATVISGLGHIEGKEVNILADGAVHPRRTVTDGEITLDNSASTVHVGLPIEADLQTLPVAFQIDNAFGQGRTKNVNRAWLRVYRSSGVFVGPSLDALTESKQRTNEPYGAPPSLKNEEIEIRVSPSWSDGGQVYVRQVDPLPLTIAGLTLEVAVGG